MYTVKQVCCFMGHESYLTLIDLESNYGNMETSTQYGCDTSL